ncbi:MAG: MoaD/ThiS family protein [Conexivisphaerales archaeon]
MVKARKIKVKVLFWAQAREIAGTGEEYYQLGYNSKIEELIEEILKKHPGLGNMKTSVRVAINGEMSSGSPKLKDGDVIALLPPFAGG